MRRTTLLLVILTACNPTDGAASSGAAANKPAEAKPAEPTTPTEVATKPDATKPDATKPDATKPEAGKLDAGKARELRKQYRSLLDEGRTLTKADKLEEAMAKYDAALAIDPSNPTVLGELGWAQFKANKLDDAQATTMHALRFVKDDKARGMLYYNLGRIAEARTENDAAITYYRTSLEKRPGNATVQGHLDALLAGAPPVEPPEGLERLAEGVVDIAAACKVIIEQRCEDYGGDPENTDEDDGFCACSGPLHTTPPGDDSWGLLTLRIDDYMQHAYFPVVKTSSGLVVFEDIEWVYNPGMMGIYEEVTFGPTKTELLLPGAAEPQLVLAWKKDRTDSDMGVNEFESVTTEAIVVCTREGAQAWCTNSLVWADSYIRDVQFPEEEEEEPIDHEGLPDSDKYSATFAWRDGKLIVSNVQREGEPGGEFTDAGEYPLTELLGR